eukprot:3510557-Pyramimonas_sp.AAC.1
MDCAREIGPRPCRSARAAEASQGMTGGNAPRRIPPDRSICKRCAERDDWKRSLTPQSHGCSACKEVFEEGAWGAKVMKHHRYSDADLACPGCAERGFAPGQIDEHQCEDCLEHLGSLAFD